MKMKRLWHMCILMIRKEGFKKAEYIKKHNLFGHIGENCYYHPFSIPAESKLISFGDNVVIATGVQLITHDMSYALLGHDTTLEEKIGLGCYPYYTNGIQIGNNVMVGANALIMPGVNIGNNVVVGGGTVVTRDIPDGVVAAGCPARVVGDYWEYAKKRQSK